MTYMKEFIKQLDNEKLVEVEAVDDWRCNIESRLEALERAVYPTEESIVDRSLTYTDHFAMRVDALESLVRTHTQERGEQ